MGKRVPALHKLGAPDPAQAQAGQGIRGAGKARPQAPRLQTRSAGDPGPAALCRNQRHTRPKKRQSRCRKLPPRPAARREKGGNASERSGEHKAGGDSRAAPLLAPDKRRGARDKGKARRLKQAKEEAQMEVEQYRREQEQEFQSKQQAAMGSQGNLSAEVEQATRRQIQSMQSSQQHSREGVLAQLLGMVCDIRPQIHPNYRIAA
ncbi:V-type proton ATPase subunit G 2 isoform 1-T1 [Sarcophilus harrisii]